MTGEVTAARPIHKPIVDKRARMSTLQQKGLPKPRELRLGRKNRDSNILRMLLNRAPK